MGEPFREGQGPGVPGHVEESNHRLPALILVVDGEGPRVARQGQEAPGLVHLPELAGRRVPLLKVVRGGERLAQASRFGVPELDAVGEPHDEDPPGRVEPPVAHDLAPAVHFPVRRMGLVEGS